MSERQDELKWWPLEVQLKGATYNGKFAVIDGMVFVRSEYGEQQVLIEHYNSRFLATYTLLDVVKKHHS
jgi:hypothetical protein